MSARERIERAKWESFEKDNPGNGWQPCGADRVLQWAANHGETAEGLASAAIDEMRPVHGEFAIYRMA